MAKSDIHPKQYDVMITLNNGEKFSMKLGCDKGVMQLDIDPTNHPAWRSEQGTFLNTNNDQVSKFKKKYGSIFGNN